VETVDFEKLPLEERIVLTTSTKLIKHFRGLESAGIIDRDTTSNLIGCVKKLVNIAQKKVDPAVA